MHRGRGYPYHPVFYATEAWFWPGWMPYQMGFDVFDNAAPPWNIYPSGHGEISTPGVPSADCKIITYDFPAFEPLCGLRIRLYKGGTPTKPNAVWHMRLTGGAIPVVYGEAYALQDYPQRRVLVNHWDIVTPQPPYSGHLSPPYQFSPARWGQGVDPYPSRP